MSNINPKGEAPEPTPDVTPQELVAQLRRKIEEELLRRDLSEVPASELLKLLESAKRHERAAPGVPPARAKRRAK